MVKISFERMMWELEDIEELVFIYPNHKVLKKITRLSEKQRGFLISLLYLPTCLCVARRQAKDTVRQTYSGLKSNGISGENKFF
ncbi:hypothetical protein HS1_001674 [Candidatus Desulfofervidus auxilii]|uniref:Uncharacterized protein n=1 Tax=Desulfofervidus auxilii TaxID=1621989 RepID=A0A7U4QLC4_DESA2|nr:hypothetical protein [Candidatus Desulfofervidus auxilii]AMM41468.1 hypothetical protein HS1_001674 [Candidatus Desulfofervidus auxilii]CAD7779423.1 hypothetical protein DMNBHIDG_02071 [Candidatus Methanoperedenaceae archaeon GB37]CAD7781946.1 MAG: hypothetical protein KIIPBIDF_01553 [Candidatus Methanoperedenaceae archaeon GB50]